MDINKLTIGEAREIAALVGAASKSPEAEAADIPFHAGESILIRTVTMTLLGRVRTIGADFIVLDDGGWVADTGRFSEALLRGDVGEYEKAPSWIVVGRGSIVDIYPWSHELPRETK